MSNNVYGLFNLIFTFTGTKGAFTTNSASNLHELVYSKSHAYVPDFTVKALTDLEFIKVRRHQYIAAQRATLMERQPKTPRESELDQTADAEEIFCAEWKKANQLTQTNCQEEGIALPSYLKHQRNYSSGNLEELKRRRDIKLSPLIISSSYTENGPLRTVIYPDSPTNPNSAENEQTHLLADASHGHNGTAAHKSGNFSV